MKQTELQSWRPIALSLLRIVAGFVFLLHGTQKVFGFPVGPPVQGFSLLLIAGWLEVPGGILILLGLFTRPVAFILCGQMAVAYFTSHLPNGFWPLVNRGELALLFCFIYLYLVAAGPGPWSLDAILRRKG